ncbi:MAG: MATE family efflux transporter [Mediterraneibacter faecis]
MRFLWLFFSRGIAGAAMASALGQIVGGIIPLIYFARKNTSRLRIVRPEWDGRALLRICTNGCSELMSNISMSVVGMLYNTQLMKYAGEDGVTAYGTIMYVNFIFIAIFIGYATGVAPVISYHYGCSGIQRTEKFAEKSSALILISSALMFGVSELMAKPLAGIFVGYDAALLDMTAHGFSIYAVSFIFAGIAIFGPLSLQPSMMDLHRQSFHSLRTLLFECASVMILPLILGLNGIWCSIVVAEFMAVVVTLIFLVVKRKKYGYW